MSGNLMIDYNRDSFNRFCDDLCEVLLKYLSFKDVINFECVSKQWMRCLFKTRYQLFVTRFRNNNSYAKTIVELPVKTITKFYEQNQDFAQKIIENLLKKCSHINSLIIDYDRNDVIMRTIIDNCKHVSTVKFNRELYDNQMVKYLLEKSGHNLINLNFYGWTGNKNRDLLKLCPNLKQITNINVSDVITGDQVLVPKLSEVIRLYGCDKTDLMNSFVKRYANSINKFEVMINHNSDTQNTLLDQISRLSNLLVLKISFINFPEVTPHFPEKIANIGHNCRKINCLEICVFTIFIDWALISRNTIFIFSAIQCFTNLTHLKLILPYYDCIDGNTELTASLIKHCKQLTHLSIEATITDTFFNSIHEYLPQLSVITINTDKLLTDDCLMNCLSKLKDLKSLKIDIIDTDMSLFTNRGLYSLINNCVHIKSLKLKPLPNISIEELCKIAINNCRINFDYYFYGDTLSSDPIGGVFTDIEANNIKFYGYND